MSILDALKKLVVKRGGTPKGSNIAEVIDDLAETSSGGGTAIIQMGENLKNEIDAVQSEAMIKASGSLGKRVSATRVIPKDSGAAWDEWSNMCEGFAAAISANQLAAWELPDGGGLTLINLLGDSGFVAPNVINVLGPNSYMEVSLNAFTAVGKQGEGCYINVVLCMFTTE